MPWHSEASGSAVDRSPEASSAICCLSGAAETGCHEDAAHEPCPAPLSWRQVLDAFRAESTPWELDRGGCTLRGRTWGEGPPLYFLNGIGGTYELFALTVWLLRGDFRCVVFDYPTADGRRDFSLGVLADDLLAAADRHGDGRFSVYATSFGGAVALDAMLHRPERIERTVLQGAFAARQLSLCERLLVRACRRWPGRLDRVPLRRRVQFLNHRHWFPPFDQGRWEFFLDDTGQVPVKDLVHRAALLRECDLRPRLKEIAVPVLLVRSEGEGLVSEACHRELEAGLPNARSHWLHNCGHLPYLTHPHRLAKVVREFLLDQSAGL